MLIVLPPSETKAPGGQLSPMRVSFPELDPIRQALMDQLASSDVETMMDQLKIPATKRAEAEENLRLRNAPVMPAIQRYTGVLYDALDASTLPTSALSHLAVGSALFGLLLSDDLVPRYRVSAGSKVDNKTMKAWWGKAVTEQLAEQDFVVDMRSGAYQQLGPLASAMTVRVEQADTGKVVSHFNKQYKGELARSLAMAPSIADATSINDVADLALARGFQVRINGQQLTLLV